MSVDEHRRKLEGLVGKEFSPLIEQCIRRKRDGNGIKPLLLESIEDALNATAQNGVNDDDARNLAHHLKLAYLYGRKMRR